MKNAGYMFAGFMTLCMTSIAQEALAAFNSAPASGTTGMYNNSQVNYNNAGTVKFNSESATPASTPPDAPTSAATAPSSSSSSPDLSSLPSELQQGAAAGANPNPPGAPTPPPPPPPPPVSPTIQVGDMYNGGIVVWLDQSTSPPHGFAAELNDEPSIYSWITAKYECRVSQVPSSTNGWRLPTIQELLLMNTQIVSAQETGQSGGVSFASSGKYWSSSEYSPYIGWSFNSGTGEENLSAENEKLYVHCVMSF